MSTKTKLLSILCCCLAVMALTSCKKQPIQNPTTPPGGPVTPPPKTPDQHAGAVRPVGAPKGNALSFTVTSSGGHFSTDDHSLDIDIPAGAVNTSTTLTIQEVENTCQAGLGTSYSLTPHGTQFAKPVTVKFSYSGLEDEIGSPDVLGICFQDEKGIWNWVKGAVVDKTAKTVSVTTTHFSNWTMGHWLVLVPVTAKIGPAKDLNLEVRCFLDQSDSSILAPLYDINKVTAEMDLGHEITGDLIKTWSLGGVGMLHDNGTKAVYSSPETVTAPTVVAVSVELKTPKEKVLLVSNISIIPEGITYRINGGPWKFIEASAASLPGSGFSISTGMVEGKQLTINWPGGLGTFSWNKNGDQGKTTTVELINMDFTGYVSYYDKPDLTTKDSGGFLKIDELGSVGANVVGSFYAKPASYRDFAAGKQLNTVTFEGFFNVMRIL